MPVNPLLKPPQVAYILADCDVRVLVTSADRLALLADELGDCPALEHVVLVAPGASRRDRAVRRSALRGARLVRRLRRRCAPLPRSAVRIDLDLAAILYTSGSTGKPKGVVLSHRNLIVGRRERQRVPRQRRADDVILSALPLSFDAGLSQLTTAFSRRGARRPDELPAARGRRPALRAAQGHGADLRPAAVDPDRRAGLAGRGRASTCATSPTPAGECRRPPWIGSAPASRRRRRT